MTHYTNCSEPEQLKTFYNPDQPTQVKKTQLFSIIKNIWRQIGKRLVQENEPRVWQKRDRFGQTYWYGYDPVTGSSVCRSSEAEMRIWLEERYYR